MELRNMFNNVKLESNSPFYTHSSHISASTIFRSLCPDCGNVLNPNYQCDQCHGLYRKNILPSDFIVSLQKERERQMKLELQRTEKRISIEYIAFQTKLKRYIHHFIIKT